MTFMTDAILVGPSVSRKLRQKECVVTNVPKTVYKYKRDLLKLSYIWCGTTIKKTENV